MPRQLTFVPVCEALEERRVLSSTKVQPPGLDVAESRHEARPEKTHTPPGQAVAALHRNNIQKDKDTPATPNSASPYVPTSSPYVPPTNAGQTPGAVARMPQQVDIPDSLEVLDVVGRDGIAQAAVESLLLPLPQPAARMLFEDEFTAPNGATMMALDSQAEVTRDPFMPLPMCLGATSPESAFVQRPEQVSSTTIPSGIAVSALHFQPPINPVVATDAFEGDALAAPTSANADVLMQGIRQFLDQLDDMAGEVSRSLSDSPYLAWCIVLGSGFSAGELARRFRKRKQSRPATRQEGIDGSSWAPGLPYGVVTDVL